MSIPASPSVNVPSSAAPANEKRIDTVTLVADPHPTGCAAEIDLSSPVIICSCGNLPRMDVAEK